MSTAFSASAMPAGSARPADSRRTRHSGARTDGSTTPVLPFGPDLDERIGNADAAAARADEHRVEIDRRESSLGCDHEVGKSHTAVHQGIDVARTGAAKSLQQLCRLQAAQRGQDVLRRDVAPEDVL